MLKWVLFISLAICIEATYLENYYCDESNCYELLGVTREATKAEIKKAFRSLALKNHPDKFIDTEEKAAAESRFKKLATAKDILIDDEFRSDYDYFLDHPDEFYMNYYRAWRRRNYPNVDVRIVIAVLITLISGAQYYNGWSKYEEVIKHFAAQPKYRLKAEEIAKGQGIWIAPAADKKKNKSTNKQQLKDDQEKIIRQVIEDKMDIRGVYAKPTMYDLLWVQLAMLPVWTYQFLHWYGSWTWNHTIKKRPLGEEEKLYVIRKNMKLSEGQWMTNFEEDERRSFLKQDLWKKDEFAAWKAEQDEQTRLKNAGSSKHKQYKRYMKNHGGGRMYFDD